ncbi:RNA pyrophosphohydrolase [Novispirillum itersonii]|uniref:RNA pyrophosphohydrolase n=1 Tax=Novispirillum itersonii TaxID=189 RepID=A0A7W9ZEC8_NOVIT|nr:RNA pyrophosphohydrolase [Novispirillum itersonii]MBB6209860.1 putative (di)nucleoside polyphosphate hydrolase [Novispirillum itersonii]
MSRPSVPPVDLSSLPYRPCAGIMLVNADNKVFVARRIDTDQDAWQMPQGGIDSGENPRDAARRELLEEIGTNAADLLAETDDWLYYDLPADLVGKVWKGRYRGQMQKWFLMRFTGQDSDITLETEHPEFNAWQWVPLADVPRLIVPFKRDIYQQICDRFGPLLSA